MKKVAVLILILVMSPVLLATPSSATSGRGFIPPNKWVTLEFNASRVPELVGAWTSTLAAYMYVGGWIQLQCGVLPQRVPSFYPVYNRTLETFLWSDRIRENDRIRVLLPIINAGSTDMWGINQIRGRAKERVLIEVSRDGSALTRFYLYFSHNTTGLRVPLPPPQLNGEVGSNLDISVKSYQYRGHFNVSDDALHEGLFNPARVIDGGDGGEWGNTVFSHNAGSKTVTPTAGLTRSGYLGYEVTVLKVIVHVKNLQYSSDYLVAEMTVTQGQSTHSKTLYQYIYADDSWVELDFSDIVAYSSTVPARYTLHINSLYGDVSIDVMVYFRAEREGQNIHEKSFSLSFAKPFWTKPNGLYLPGDSVTLTGVTLPKGGMVSGAVLHVHIDHVDENPDAPDAKPMWVYLDGTLIAYRYVYARASGWSKEYVADITLNSQDNDQFIEAALSSVVYDSSASLTVKVPGLGDANTITSVESLLTGEYMPEVWEVGSSSYRAKEHTLGSAATVITDLTDNYRVVGRFSAEIAAGGEPGWASDEFEAFRHVAVAVHPSGSVLYGTRVQRVDVYVDIPSSLNPSDFGHNEWLSGQVNQWLNWFVDLVKDVTKYSYIATQVVSIFTRTGGSIVGAGSFVLARVADYLQSQIAHLEHFDVYRNGDYVTLHYTWDGGMQTIETGSFRMFFEIAAPDNAPAYYVIHIRTEVWVSGGYNSGVGEIDYSGAVGVFITTRGGEPYSVYGLRG